MASTLTEVLQAIQAADKPLTIRQLSLRFNLNPQVVLDMLTYWERRGRIRISEPDSCPSPDAAGCAHCPVKNCDAAASASVRYEIIKN